jgi:hypothetical protein
MATAKSAVEGSVAKGKEIASAPNPKAAVDIAVSARPDLPGAVAYGEQLKVIIDDIRNEFNQAADAHLVEAKSTLTALIYDLTQNVKPGTENAVDIIKTAIDNAFKGYEQVTQATRDAMRAVEEKIANANAQVVAQVKPEGAA